MDVDLQGNTFVIDQFNRRVLKFDPDGALLMTLDGEFGEDGGFSEPIDVAIDAEGNMFVTDGATGMVEVFDATGGYLGSFGAFGSGEGQVLSADGVALDGEGGIYIADPNYSRLVKFHLLPPLGPEATPTA
jgi:DNA-binding beta-propeller fold protein YncE